MMPKDRGWEPGDQVLCRTAMGDEVIGTATSGIVMGRDMQVVWIDFGDRRHCLPWPANAVRGCNSFTPDEGSTLPQYDGTTATNEGGKCK